jgi:hypothetical protein
MWSGTVQLASGTPFTARIIGDVTDVSQGTNGSLRADYNGAPITLDDKTVLEYFNHCGLQRAASRPVRQRRAQHHSRPRHDEREHGAHAEHHVRRHALAVDRVQANNVFNIVQFVAIDTMVNSPTFGHVIAARPMRSVQIVARVRF